VVVALGKTSPTWLMPPLPIAG